MRGYLIFSVKVCSFDALLIIKNMTMRNLLCMLLMFVAMYSKAQITIGNNVAEVKHSEVKYDSLSNINKTNIMSLKGQTLFVRGSSFAKSNDFSFLFYEEKGFPKDSYKKKLYKQTKVNRDGYGSSVTPYDAIVGRYFLISDVFEQKSTSYVKDRSEYCLFLKEVNGKDSLFCYLKGLSSPAFPESRDLLILGFYEKLKERYLGRTFKVTGKRIFERCGNKENVEVSSGVSFKCIDVAVDLGDYDNLYAVLENDNIGKIKGAISEMGEISNVIDLDKYNLFVKKYGVNNANLIIAGKVKIGMTEQMAIESWGSPKDGINETKGAFGVHEQWCYGNGRYLYFENGKLTAIQD